MKQKAYAYITREMNGSLEILVFSQKGFPEAGLQVPGGTVEENEKPTEAIAREIWEETGLEELELLSEVASDLYFHEQKQEFQDRHFYHIQARRDLPETWEFIVNSGSQDKGLTFCYEWLPIARAGELAGSQGQFVSLLRINFK